MKIDPEFKALIPPLAADELQQLEENIRKDGCRDALVVWDGILIDGHNRFEICTRWGFHFKTKAIEFKNRNEAMLWIVRNQLGRRNLQPFTRSVLVLKSEEVIKAMAKANQKLGGEVKVPQNSVKPPIDTQKELAKLANTSHDTISKAKVIEAKATPEVKAKLHAGEVSINQAYVTIKREEKKADHAEKVKAAAADTSPRKTGGPYDIIMADPPWQYDHQEAENRAIENQYPTADLSTICSHGAVSKKDAILFLWATAPKLTEALTVMQTWGFTYKTCAVWDKEIIGMGYWFRGQHELLLVGVKGNPGATPEPARCSSVFREKRGKHSRKPESVFQWIEQAFPGKSKLEMYCREPRAGWDAWGNEV